MPTFTYTYDPNQTAFKDEVRFFVGDTRLGGWLPNQWLLADEEIDAVVGRYSNNPAEAKAQCAIAAGRQAMVGWHRVEQGHRLKIEYHSPEKLMQVFKDMAVEARQNAQPEPGQPTNPGATGGQMCSLPYSPDRVGRRRDVYDPTTCVPGQPVDFTECDR